MCVLFRASVSWLQYTTLISKRRKNREIPEKNILDKLLLVSKVQVVEIENFPEKHPSKVFFRKFHGNFLANF